MTNQELKPQVTALIKAGKAIQAIMLVHNTLNCGLKAAKDYVDKIISEQ
ncbi:MAG: hypothetical protein U5L45_05695 [Saprospiraceae bacterium]|nr:hypothetical protein [Saprospiraceae bacterium]